MNRMAFKTFGAALAAGLGLLGGALPASAQSPAGITTGDWPNLGAFNNRQNRNVAPYRYQSGITSLRYTNISTIQDSAPLFLDNTDLPALQLSYGGPQDDPQYTRFDGAGRSLSFVTPAPAAAWRAGTSVDSGADVPLVKERGVAPYNFSPRAPEYLFDTCVPSAKGQTDPTIPVAGQTAQYFEWRFAPPTVGQNLYGVFAKIPTGTTLVNEPLGTVSRFSIPNFVYKVFFGPDANNDGLPDNSVTSVVSSVGGLSRLGVGSVANPVFPSDGTPIVIRLYNTVPRDPATGVLLTPVSTVGDSAAKELTDASQRLVYADSAEIHPIRAGSTAVATTSTVTGNALGPTPPPTLIEDLNANWDVTFARNEITGAIRNGVYATNQSGTDIDYQANLNPNGIQVVDNAGTVEDESSAPVEKWRYNIVQESSAATVNLDNDGAGATATGGMVAGTVNPYFTGSGYLTTGATPNVVAGNPAPTQTVTYAPALNEGDYAIYAYLPGNYPQTPTPTETYGTGVLYQIREGANVTNAFVDQSRPRGWVRIGTRRFDSADGLPLTVTLTNYSQGATGTQQVYADAIRFVGDASINVTSTPVHATVGIRQTPGGTPVDTRVTIVADEAGVVHCLDAAGRGDGTTVEYWRYPSFKRDANYRDPNLSVFGPTAVPTILAGPDGTFNTAVGAVNGPTATMPTGFDLSTAAVARIDDNGTNRDLLYIAASNGRIYCIDMAGRGDYDLAGRIPGTTGRRWTYPDDYNPVVPTAPIGRSNLGSFRGSVVFGDTGTPGAPVPTVYAAAPQGRVFALNALGPVGGLDNATSSYATSTRWAFPAVGGPTLPAISMTPTFFQSATTTGRLLFGTAAATDQQDGPGEFYCLEASSGLISWQIDGTDYPNGSYVNGIKNRKTETDYGTSAFLGFFAGPAAVDAATLLEVPQSAATPTATPSVDTAYVLNGNGYMLGLNIADGTVLRSADATNTPYRFLIDTLTDRSLTYTVTEQFSRALTGLQERFPTIAVPSDNGEMAFYFARVDDYTGNGDFPYRAIRRAPRPTVGTSSALNGVSAANNFAFVTDADGGLFAYGDASPFSNLGFYPGGRQDDGPNDRNARPFRRIRIRLLNKEGFTELRKTMTDPANPTQTTATLTYSQALSNAYAKPLPAGGSPYAFEWGETAYVLVYGFPYATTSLSGNREIGPAQVLITVNTEGRTARRLTVTSRRFRPNPGNPTDPPLVDVLDQNTDNPDGLRADGFGLLPFSFGDGPQTSLPPGPGSITAAISTKYVDGNTQIEYVPDQITTGVDRSTIPFIMANPLAVVVSDPNTGNFNPIDGYNIGHTTVALNPGNLVNGTPDLPTPPGPFGIVEGQLQATTGTNNHGTIGATRIYVVDRSLTTVRREEGLGNIRLSRTNLRRQGGANAIFRALPSSAYPGFEDLPTNSPNDSLDYPDIAREQIRAQAVAGASTGNPVTNGISLARPTNGQNGPPLTEADVPANRVLQATAVDVYVDVPRYQPPVKTSVMSVGTSTVDDPNDYLRLRRDGRGAVLPQGYFGRLQFFVDSNSNGKLDGDTREVYRGLNLSTAVAPQTSILVGTPTVDLGSLAGGTGYSPLDPFTAGAGGPFDPWNGQWANVYKGVEVRNDGNVNLIDLRLAKGTNDTKNLAGNSIWQLAAKDIDPLAWMAAMTLEAGGVPQPGDLWSNIDTTFSAANPRYPDASLRTHALVVLPKPRVTDRVATSLVANPYPRANPNLRYDTATNQVVTSQTPLSANVVPVDGTPALRLDLSKPSTVPKVGVSVPLGFPVGNYSTQIRVVENFYPLPDGVATATNVDNEILQFANGAYDAYSDPITLTYKVRETRMTNSTTPNTAPVIDPQTGPNATLSTNVAPAATRLANGNLLVGWQSTRTSGANPTSLGFDATRIYFAGLRQNNKVNFSNGGTGAPAGNSPLWDLSQFLPSSPTAWFQKNDVPFPSNAQIAGAFSNANLVPETVRFGSPSFPNRGVANPLVSGPIAGNGLGDPLMAFVGDAQVKRGAPNPTARISESRVFVTSVTMANDGTPSGGAGALVSTASDPLTAKGKPSILQLPATNGASGAIVFYAETSAGQSSITADRLKPNRTAFATPVPLNFGDGFASVFSPSATARTYVGADANLNGKAIVELSFAGKLRGRANAETYLGRLRLGNPQATDPDDLTYAPTDTGSLHLVDSRNRTVEAPRSGSPFVSLPVQTLERLTGEGNGIYRARGVVWRRDTPAALQQTINGATVDLLVAGTGAVDSQSGLIAYDSRLGGKVYLDPELGIVRFAGAFPNRNAELRLTYRPTFLRVVQSGSSSNSSVNGLFDDRFVSDYFTDANGNTFPATPDYWFTGTGNKTGDGSHDPNAQIRNDRFLFLYGRGAAGNGITARPYSVSLRIGLRLPTPMATDVNGGVLGVQVTGNTRPYQVDPANGRVYFQAEDEDRPGITVRYVALNVATNQPLPNPITIGGIPSFVLERDEALLAVDEAANETGLAAFLDPFTFFAGGSSVPRPPLVWMFYVSTRAGYPDLFFQTIAPRYTPFAKTVGQ